MRIREREQVKVRRRGWGQGWGRGRNQEGKHGDKLHVMINVKSERGEVRENDTKGKKKGENEKRFERGRVGVTE